MPPRIARSTALSYPRTTSRGVGAGVERTASMPSLLRMHWEESISRRLRVTACWLTEYQGIGPFCHEKITLQHLGVDEGQRAGCWPLYVVAARAAGQSP